MTRHDKDYYSIYPQYGYKDRYNYFENLSEIFGVPIMKIILKAEKIGAEEDFTGLVDWVYKESQNVIRQKSNKENK